MKPAGREGRAAPDDLQAPLAVGSLLCRAHDCPQAAQVAALKVRLHISLGADLQQEGSRILGHFPHHAPSHARQGLEQQAAVLGDAATPRECSAQHPAHGRQGEGSIARCSLTPQPQEGGRSTATVTLAVTTAASTPRRDTHTSSTSSGFRSLLLSPFSLPPPPFLSRSQPHLLVQLVELIQRGVGSCTDLVHSQPLNSLSRHDVVRLEKGHSRRSGCVLACVCEAELCVCICMCERGSVRAGG